MEEGLPTEGWCVGGLPHREFSNFVLYLEAGSRNVAGCMTAFHDGLQRGWA